MVISVLSYVFEAIYPRIGRLILKKIKITFTAPDWLILYHATEIKFWKVWLKSGVLFVSDKKVEAVRSLVHFLPIMSFNTTVTAPFYQSIYADTDFNSLSWLEQRWVAYYVWIGNPIIATGLMAFLMHEVCMLSGGWLVVLIFSPRSRSSTLAAVYRGLS